MKFKIILFYYPFNFISFLYVNVILQSLRKVDVNGEGRLMPSIIMFNLHLVDGYKVSLFFNYTANIKKLFVIKTVV